MRHSTRACIACQITDVIFPAASDGLLFVASMSTPVIDITASAQCQLPSDHIGDHTNRKSKSGKRDDDSTLEATLC